MFEKTRFSIKEEKKNIRRYKKNLFWFWNLNFLEIKPTTKKRLNNRRKKLINKFPTRKAIGNKAKK